MFKREEVLKYLDDKNIDYELDRHPAVGTIKELEEKLEQSENVVKNLFIRNRKKTRYFLLILEKNKRADLRLLAKTLGTSPLSLASSKDLESLLGLLPGQVSPLGLLNDREARVELLIDRQLEDFEKIGIHPNNNRATLYLDLEDLKGLLEARGTKISYLDLESGPGK